VVESVVNEWWSRARADVRMRSVGNKWCAVTCRNEEVAIVDYAFGGDGLVFLFVIRKRQGTVVDSNDHLSVSSCDDVFVFLSVRVQLRVAGAGVTRTCRRFAIGWVAEWFVVQVPAVEGSEIDGLREICAGVWP
jgi:hypothetical protein